MQGKSVRVLTDDGLELNGLFCLPPKAIPNRKAILHIHGFTGNFYQEQFVDHIADRLTALGHAFLTVNTRGHDYIAHSLRKTASGSTFVRIGSAFDLLEDCIYDIKAWLDFLDGHGYPSVILEGESLGTVKAVMYQHHTHDERVHGVILISPVDHVGLQKRALQGQYEAAVTVARRLVETGKADELMPMTYCPLWPFPVSAKTYLSAFDPAANTGVFNFHDANARLAELSALKCPMLVTYGTVREAVVDNRVEDALARIQTRAVSARRCDTALIQGAPHNYLGHEEELATRIQNWVTTVFVRPGHH